MNALNHARELARDTQSNASSETFRELLASLETGSPICLAKLYELDYREFDLAVSAIKDWRLHRYHFLPGRMGH
jgi:hypothetical protein